MKKAILIGVTLLLIAVGGYCAYRYYQSDVLPEKQIDDAYDAQIELFARVKPKAHTSDDSSAEHSELLEEAEEVNNAVVAWLTIPDTHIDYPVCQAEDNDFYLHNGFDGQYNYELGCPFLDYRCEGDFSGFSSVIYGHHMSERRMFADISLFADADFMQMHPKGYLTLTDGVHPVTFFAYLTVYPTAPAYHAVFVNDAEKRELLEYIFTEAKHTQTLTAEDVDETANLLLLSTCTYEFDDARGILVGVINPCNQE